MCFPKFSVAEERIPKTSKAMLSFMSHKKEALTVGIYLNILQRRFINCEKGKNNLHSIIGIVFYCRYCIADNFSNS